MQALALRWLIDASRKEKIKCQIKYLMRSLMPIRTEVQQSKKEDTQNGRVNKAFAHFRW